MWEGNPLEESEKGPDVVNCNKMVLASVLNTE